MFQQARAYDFNYFDPLKTHNAVQQTRLADLQVGSADRAAILAQQQTQQVGRLADLYEQRGDREKALLLRGTGAPGLAKLFEKSIADPIKLGETDVLLHPQTYQPLATGQNHGVLARDYYGRPIGPPGGVTPHAAAAVPYGNGESRGTPGGVTPPPLTSAPASGPPPLPAIFDDLVRQHAERAGVDPALLGRLIMQESGGNPNAVSSAGAEGLGQVMPDTARQPGYGVTPMRDRTIDEQVRFSADYFAAMMRLTGGDVQKALAAYNWGPGNVQAWIERGANPAELPAETQTHGQRITSYPAAVPGGNGERGQPPGQPPPPSGGSRSLANGESQAGGPSGYGPAFDRKGGPISGWAYDPATNTWKEKAGSVTNIDMKSDVVGNKEAIEARHREYSAIRQRGVASYGLLDRLDQLENVLGTLGAQGPMAPTIYKVAGALRNMGMSQESIDQLYRAATGADLGEPGAADAANKLMNEFVTQTLAALPGNTSTNMNTEMVMRTVPGITNQAEANAWLIREVFRPQLEHDRDLWDAVRPLGRDPQLLGLDDVLTDYHRGHRVASPQSKQGGISGGRPPPDTPGSRASQSDALPPQGAAPPPAAAPTPQAPDAQAAPPPIPGAEHIEGEWWSVPDPNNPGARMRARQHPDSKKLYVQGADNQWFEVVPK